MYEEHYLFLAPRNGKFDIQHPELMKSARISTLRGAGQALMLQDLGYHNLIEASSIEEVHRFLLQGMADAAFGSASSFKVRSEAATPKRISRSVRLYAAPPRGWPDRWTSTTLSPSSSSARRRRWMPTVRRSASSPNTDSHNTYRLPRPTRVFRTATSSGVRGSTPSILTSRRLDICTGCRHRIAHLAQFVEHRHKRRRQ
jgi:hypothetical protein